MRSMCIMLAAALTDGEGVCHVAVQVFCEELLSARRGIHYRHFVTASYDALWPRYVQRDTLARHFYEARSFQPRSFMCTSCLQQ